MLLSSRAGVLWLCWSSESVLEHPSSAGAALLWATAQCVTQLAPYPAAAASQEVPQHTGGLCSKQPWQLLGFQDMPGFNFIVFAVTWQILEIGKARVSLLRDLCLSSKWEFKIKGNSTFIWEFLHNWCSSQMVCEISSGLKIFHAA